MEKRKLKLNKQTLRNLAVLSQVRGGGEVIEFPPDRSTHPECSHDNCTFSGCPPVPDPPTPPKGFEIPELPDLTDLTGALTLGR
jgi:hypothetical protein